MISSFDEPPAKLEYSCATRELFLDTREKTCVPKRYPCVCTVGEALCVSRSRKNSSWSARLYDSRSTSRCVGEIWKSSRANRLLSGLSVSIGPVVPTSKPYNVSMIVAMRVRLSSGTAGALGSGDGEPSAR
jgi:hypothetical protein